MQKSDMLLNEPLRRSRFELVSYFLLLPEATGEPMTFYIFVGLVTAFATGVTIIRPSLGYSKS